MAKQQGGGLNFRTKVDISESKARLLELKKLIADVGGISMNGGNSANFTNTQTRMTKAMRDSLAETQRLTQENVRLRNEYEQGRITAQQLAAQTRALNEQRKAEAAALRTARTAQVAANGSYQEAQQRLAALGRQIRETQGGFQNMGAAQQARIADYRRLNAELTEFDRRLGNNQRNVGNYRSAISGVGSSLGVLAAGYISAYAAIAGVGRVISSNSEISDSLADVRRTAQLTAKEVTALSVALQGINTRTSLKELLGIATIGGQLGIAKDQLAGFTKAVDQLAVTLSGELKGGAEGIAKSLGVLDNVFGISARNGGDVEKAYNQIGSSILKLGQSGLATGDFLADFGERVGGIAKQAGISLPVILSYGAVLEENGVSAEVAGTAFKRLISALSVNNQGFYAVAKFADANLTLKEFTTLINTDTKGALDLFLQGMNNGGKSTVAFNSILKSLKISGAGASQVVSALAANLPGLNGHIDESTKALEDATLASEQFAIKNDTLGASLDKLGNSMTNITTNPDSNIGKWFKEVVDSLTGGIKVIDILIGKLGGLKDSLRAVEDRRIVEDAKGNVIPLGADAQKEIDDARKRLAQTAIDARNATIAENTKQALQVGKQLSRDAILDIQAESNAKNILVKTNERLGVEEAKLADIRKKLPKTGGSVKADLERQLVIQREIVRLLKVEATSFVPRSNDDRPGSDKLSKTAQREAESALSRRESLQKQISELTQKGVNKALDADEEEIANVEAKYKKLRDLAIAFNKDPKNKGLKVDGSGLLRAQSAEEDSIRDKQAATKLKVTLDEQKQLYADYEAYKGEVGKEEADKRYTAQILTDKTYLEDLQRRRDLLTDGQKSKGGSEVDAQAAEAQLKVLDAEIAKEKLVVQKRQDDLIASLQTFEQERTNIVAQAEEQRRQLGDAATKGQLDIIAKNENLKLAALGDAHLKELDAFKELYAGIDRLSDGNARKVVGNAEDALSALKAKGIVISKELEAELKRLFSDSKDAIADRLPDRLIALANQIDNVASSVSGIDEEFGKVLGTLGNVIGQVGNIKKDMLALTKAQKTGDTLGSLTAGLGIFSAGIGIIGSIFKLFDRSEQREEQASYARDLQNKQTEALNKALERQVALLNDAYGTERITKYNAAILQAAENQAKYSKELEGRYSLSGNKTIDDQLTKLNNGEDVGYFKATIKANQAAFDALKLPKELDALQRLLDEGKLDSNTAAIVTNLIAANKQAADLANSLRAERVGAGLDTIVDEFMTNLESGVGGIEDVLTKAIRRGLLNSLKGDITDKFLQDYYSMLDKALTDGNISADEDALLREQLKKADEYGKARLDYINKAAPETATDGAQNATMVGRITAITGQEADKLTGAFTGMQVAVLKTNSKIDVTNDWMSKIHNEVSGNLSNIQANTLRTANNTDRLANMEVHLATLVRKADDNKKAAAGNGYI
jgi:TP901 family phage tail tape measure protein